MAADERLARLEAKMAATEQFLEGMTAVTQQVWRNAESAEGLNREMERLRREMQEAEARQKLYTERVESACSSLSQRLDQKVTANIGARATMTVGFMGFAGTLAAVLIHNG